MDSIHSGFNCTQEKSLAVHSKVAKKNIQYQVSMLKKRTKTKNIKQHNVPHLELDIFSPHLKTDMKLTSPT